METKEINDSIGAQVLIKEIEKIRQRDQVKYMDAVVYYCEENRIEIESIAAIITNIPVLCSRIQKEAEELNYLEKTRRLPL